MIKSIVIKLNQHNKIIPSLLIYILNFAQISSSKKYFSKKFVENVGFTNFKYSKINDKNKN